MSMISIIGGHAALCAAAAAITKHPIGPRGGAIFGAIYGATWVCIGALSEDSTTRRTSSAGAGILLSIGQIVAAWKLTTMYGINMSFKAAVLFSTVPSLVILAAVVLVGEASR